MLLVVFGTWAAASGIYGLWDAVRSQVECRGCGTYHLPFGYPLAWWFAGDLLVTFSLGGFALVLTGVSGLLLTE